MCLCVLINIKEFNLIEYDFLQRINDLDSGQKDSSSWMTWDYHFCIKNMYRVTQIKISYFKWL